MVLGVAVRPRFASPKKPPAAERRFSSPNVLGPLPSFGRPGGDFRLQSPRIPITRNRSGSCSKAAEPRLGFRRARERALRIAPTGSRSTAAEPRRGVRRGRQAALRIVQKTLQPRSGVPRQQNVLGPLPSFGRPGGDFRVESPRVPIPTTGLAHAPQRRCRDAVVQPGRSFTS